MTNTLLVFGSKNFNNSLDEIKEYLDFSLIFFNDNILFDDVISRVSAIVVDSETCNDATNIDLIKTINNKPILLIENQASKKKCNYTDKINFPLILFDFNTKIVNLITSKKFSQNSSVKVKEYIIDKNEKKIKRDNLFITITEREIQLIELLFNEKKPITKNILLKQIWKYSEGADTHTVETHIYRLRKKINEKFSDDNFILNNKEGYYL